MSYQKFVGVGNATRMPELRYTPQGTAICTVGLAFNRRFKQGEELKEEVCFLDCVLWAKRAENFAKFVSKGNPVLVEGHLTQRSWETEDGQKRHKHELSVEEFRLLTKKPADEPAEEYQG